MSGELRTTSNLWTIIETRGGVGHDIDVEEELANILRQEINLEIIHDLNMLSLPNLLRKLAPVHPTEVFPR
jgi:hypothetical protein